MKRAKGGRLQLILSENAYADMEKAAKLFNTSKVDTVRRALFLAAMISEDVSVGRTYIVRERDGREKEIVFVAISEQEARKKREDQKA